MSLFSSMKPREESFRPLDYATPGRAHQKASAPDDSKARTPVLPYLPLLLAILQLPFTMIVGALLLLFYGDMNPVPRPGSLSPRAIVWVTLLPSAAGVLLGAFVMVLFRPTNIVDRVFAVVGMVGCAGAIIVFGLMAGN
jgi:hypothetical protein